jgi:cell division protein FtsL
MDSAILGLAVLLAATSVSLVWVIILCRQAIRDRDRLLDERGARLVDLWRDLEEKEARIATLERGNERLTQLAVSATEGWRDAVVSERTRVT